jgi:predicted acyltransferase
MGVLSLLLGALWSAWLPLNKNLWTPSFVLWCAGWATLAMLVFHVLIDRHGWPALGRRFGVNAIAAYAGSELMQILLPALGWQEPLYRHLFANWMTPRFGAFIPSLAFALVFVAVWWLIIHAMDRRRWYLKL